MDIRVQALMKKRCISLRKSIALLMILSLGLYARTPFVLQKEIALPAALFSQGIQPDIVQPGPNNTVLLLDRDSKNVIHLTAQGAMTISGGFGQSEESLFDPVDMIVDQMTVNILDRGRNGWVQFDYQLHFLDFFPLAKELDPYRFTMDSFGNIFVVGYSDQGIFRKTRIGWDTSLFIDFQYLPQIPEFIQLLVTNNRGELAFLSQNPDQLMVFSSTGRLLYQQAVVEPEQIKGLIFTGDKWLLARQSESKLFFQSGPETEFILPEKDVRSVVQSDHQIIVLTSNNIRIYQLQP
ncbi:MAG: hypothetical protein GXO90_04975 [FCB group bacterium]|nr:hypothetical protein [FCB group bacterium]